MKNKNLLGRAIGGHEREKIRSIFVGAAMLNKNKLEFHNISNNE